ncbi:hypothetical protein BCR34DRAFT_474575 [Clohesyomyces aquaticus]|uniref:DUF7605 domain-containing protein n=1 Tax=Clohesyomyces aquaticus TaxID=1231657 RepID=A0A1Y2A5T1_9PLEO|nr:hypothetical protein BCR34DRAFT_474575 [Clohesyomyces aquaticus]
MGDYSDDPQTPISPSTSVHQPGEELLYDIESELPTDEPFFQQSFQEAFNVTRQELKDVTDAIRACSASHRVGSHLHKLKETARQISEFEPQSSRIIGLVGKPSVGKSDVISALLDQPHLNILNNKHSASVVIEYRHQPVHHEDAFSLEVEYMSKEEMKEIVDDLVRRFRTCYMPPIQGIESIQARRKALAESETAWHMLKAMFRNQSNLSEEFLLSDKSEHAGVLSDVLLDWIEDCLAGRPGGMECHIWKTTAVNVDELTEKLDVFTTNETDEITPALWPYIKVIRLFSRASILRSGIVLVDCPAPNELDCVRSRAVNDRLRDCREIFAVTTIDGALSDESVQDTISHHDKIRPLRIICTKSDDINTRDVEKKQPEVALEIRKWRRQIGTLQNQAKRWEAQRRHGLSGALEEEARRRDLLEDAKFSFAKFLIEDRNCSVATQLLDKYTAEVRSGDLKIFCVSDKKYWDHRFDEHTRAESRLELSGVVNLRKYCHLVTAEAQFVAAAAFVEIAVPTFLGSVRQWTLGGKDEVSEANLDDVRQLVRSLEHAAVSRLIGPSTQIYKAQANLEEEFASSILQPIREHQPEWQRAAYNTSKEWAKLDPKTYAHFCDNYGMHTTATTATKASSQNWNDEIISSMRAHLQSNWSFFHESIEETRRELTSSISTVFSSLTLTLEPDLHLAPPALQNLTENMTHYLNAILHDIHQSFDDILEQTEKIEVDTLYAHAPTAHINTLMRPAYAAANKETEHRGRRRVIPTHLASRNIFAELADVVEKQYTDVLDLTFERMARGIKGRVDALVADLHCLIHGEASAFPECSARLRHRVESAQGVVEGARRVVEGVRDADFGTEDEEGDVESESESVSVRFDDD